MNRKLNYEQIKLMAETGFCKSQIADRLNCSYRQICRIARRRNIVFSKSAKRIIGSNDEYRLWRYYYSIDQSYTKTALRFGVSRQAIWEHINKSREAA